MILEAVISTTSELEESLCSFSLPQKMAPVLLSVLVNGTVTKELGILVRRMVPGSQRKPALTPWPFLVAFNRTIIFICIYFLPV